MFALLVCVHLASAWFYIDAGTMRQQQTAHTPASPSRSGTSSVESTGKVTTTLAATAPQAKPRSNQRGRFPSASASHSATVPTNRDRVEAQFFATVGRQNSYDHGGRQDNGVHDQYAGGNMVSLPTNSVAQIEPVDTESGRAVGKSVLNSTVKPYTLPFPQENTHPIFHEFLTEG